MFQSRYFERVFPRDNAAFERVELVDAIPKDRDASLARMREAMLTGPFVGGFFIGGMEGVEEEFAMFSRTQPGFPAFPIASTGAAAAKLFDASPERVKIPYGVNPLSSRDSTCCAVREIGTGTLQVSWRA